MGPETVFLVHIAEATEQSPLIPHRPASPHPHYIGSPLGFQTSGWASLSGLHTQQPDWDGALEGPVAKAEHGPKGTTLNLLTRNSGHPSSTLSTLNLSSTPGPTLPPHLLIRQGESSCRSFRRHLCPLLAPKTGTTCQSRRPSRQLPIIRGRRLQIANQSDESLPPQLALLGRLSRCWDGCLWFCFGQLCSEKGHKLETFLLKNLY